VVLKFLFGIFISSGGNMLTRQFFKNKRVTVFGLGLNGGGVATVKFLAKWGAKEIIVTDIKKRAELASSLESLKGYKNITYVLGQHRPEDFTRVDMVVMNPGIPWTNEYVKLALARNIPVEMDASLFFQLCSRPIIGVTGTKGKTTTSTLLAEMLRTAGYPVVRAGISQVPVLDVLDEVKARSVVVFELSSWRLSSLGRIRKSPHVAILTNLFPDHLNYYKNFEAYKNDKKFIFAFQEKQDWLVFNAEDENVRSMVVDAKARTIPFSQESFEGNSGVFVRDDTVFAVIGDKEMRIVALADISLRGRHNRSNILAAAGGALAYGADVQSIRKTLLNFTGVPHRLELVREYEGVKYYNDTAATVPEAAISALSSFDEPVVLIAGGSNKGLDFSAFGEAIAAKPKEVIFLKGEATEKLLKSIRKHLPEEKKDREWTVVDSMEVAVCEASRLAQAGDVVLLSPGAASFGLFRNEFDRGEQFRKAVKNLGV
jgi:UDP-N-acetylmuramoylalanine--D-glutamate ligase